MSDVRFRLIGINQDNRADDTGKAGLTFQAIGYFNIKSSMNTANSNSGGWRDAILRKNLNDESTGTIWNAIQSTDFKNNITPVLKTTYKSGHNSDASFTADKLYILSPSEMGMPVIKNYNVISGNGGAQRDANIHYYDSDSYKNTIKSSSDGSKMWWGAYYSYLYAGNAYQWWMLPTGSRKMSNGNQAYHNTDQYSYCAILNSDNPSNKTLCYINYSYWLRSSYDDFYYSYYMSEQDEYWWYSHLSFREPSATAGVVVSFSF